ncbi:MAG: AraC family transcriptional regulator [Lachnospiraceae bacterium]|nr:AraC family transcriptional regulator [Lachnospiraceae bacterium]
MNNFKPTLPTITYFIYRKCNSDWVIENKVVDFHDLTYIVSGKGVYLIDGVENPVSAGDLVYISNGHIRQAWTSHDEPLEVYAINFTQNPETLLPFSFVSKIGHDPKIIALFTQLTRVWREREELFSVDASALSLQIIVELIRRLCKDKPENRMDLRIEKVKDYINVNYEKPLSVPELADIVGLHPTYLGALFMQCESQSIKDYINKIRINQAYEIIRAEMLPVNEVAYICGYTDTFYFSRVFKKYIGVPPSQVYK